MRRLKALKRTKGTQEAGRGVKRSRETPQRALVLKYPDDFKGWKELGKIRRPLGGNYLVLVSPDGSKFAQIHVEDNDVAIVLERRPPRVIRVIYMHHTSVKALNALLKLVVGR